MISGMTNELRELLEAYHCRDVVTQDLIDRIEAEFQRLRSEIRRLQQNGDAGEE